MKSIITLTLIALFAFGCADKNAGAPAGAPATLPVMEIAYASTSTETEYPVAIQGKTDVEIRPQVSGTLDQIFVDEGAYVTAGQSLFKINEKPYREQYNNASASLNAAEAAVLNAQLEVEKLTPLVANKVVSDYQLKTAKANLAIAKATVAQTKATVGSAQINLGYTIIKAPVSGYIGRLPKKQGSLISPADPESLTTLSDTKDVYAYFSLSENEFINFKSLYKGNTLNEKLKGLAPVSLVLSDDSVYPQQGKIDMIDGQFDKTTGAITMRATFPNANGLLRSGNTGKVKISIQHQNAIVIPQDATVEIQDKVYVFLVDKKNAVTRQPVSVSGKSGTTYLIKDGISTGDRIVLKGFENLPDGATIIPESGVSEQAKQKKTVAKL
ncbi:efflux RND transporter periplasmic adaptor subunit [Flavobacterium silvaticum]|uniref:Efflux RND transporter periplasmic adaptor subunit n=1 Tax=Flavobacterium silvaticum TaxID=1852020 RepID=A0A972JG69_9FLAO|nr:efflux RND transporter periplasmic adaptor subunit [Flavobacterium silvaticum]NMH28739.1 efflux RND transporter periplasmic adaptor subunit [Flavobacterium silvaticum]